MNLEYRDISRLARLLAIFEYPDGSLTFTPADLRATAVGPTLDAPDGLKISMIKATMNFDIRLPIDAKLLDVLSPDLLILQWNGIVEE